jgi:hypothetical protein
MNKSLFGGALLVFAFVSAGRASTITYDVDLTTGTASVTGFIETDGTIGTLASTNFLDWNLEVDDGISSFDLLGPLEGSNSFVEGSGDSASGSLAALTFDTSTDDTSILLFFSNDSTALFCAQDQGRGCDGSPPGTLAWNANQTARPQPGGNVFITTDGVTTIGTAETTGTPEPSTLMLMVAALGISTLLRNRLVSSSRSSTATYR